MQVNSGDIINYNSEIYLSQDYILKHADVGYNYLRVAKSRFNTSKSVSWKYEKILNKDYFAYNYLPIAIQTKLLPLAALIDSARETNDDITSIIQAAKISSYKKFQSKFSSDELTIAAAIINDASIYISLNGISFSKSAFFEKLAKEVELQEIKHLPKTWRNLRDKIKEYAEGKAITDLIFEKNKGNANRAKFANNDIIKGWLFGLIESQKNYSAAYIFRQTRRMCLQSQISDFPSKRWVSDFLALPETQYITQQRYGANNRHNHKYRVYTPTQSALFAGDCWQIDGTRVNIIDHKATYYNKEGKKVTGQKFLYIIAVRDVMSGMVMGWEYCYDESATAVTNALANAVRNAGYLPYEFIYDRFPGHNTSEWKFIETQFRMAGTVMTVTHKAEGKANIERWWGTLQDVFMMDSELYYGEGIKSTRRYAHRSKEYVASMRQWASKNDFNYDKACNETNKILTSYINTPFSEYSNKFKNIDQSPLQLHEECEKPNVYRIPDYAWCFMFGLNKGVQISNYMITTQIEGATFYYGIDDCDLIEKYTGVKLTNCFDYEDLSKVHLFDGDTYLGTFSEIKPAQRFGPNKDLRAVGKIKSIANKVEADRKTKIAAIKAIELPDQQDNYGEVAIMQGGIMKKPAYEAAESAFLLNEWDNEDVVITARNQY
ncbi:integrase catalytic domain-containing protein [Dysgonomonas sp. HGC4]|uniref:integrase catalytic domain-containing protein n=1 Tax=Dysgonomonas sp. HGC4 TaxID=1658009 RepID=UPI000681927C|nr:DDE-type integrase/transposase/recombinase [Dysgonomonas sp. HGC4]MBD8348556.1 DDE-type integrase/transposase/recombinase [Dysgonomonas sp. HGC4]